MLRNKLLLAVGAAAITLGGPAAAEPVASVKAAAGADIVRDPTDIPAPIARRNPETVRVSLNTVEVVGQLDDGTAYRYWTFNGKVPGPFVRVRVGDTVEVTLGNAPDSMMMHNVDMHAVTGPGGGAVATMVSPGESKGFTFKALSPGLYVYHCAAPMVAQHIANGMYGMILVEPAEGLPKVDHEFYVMQGEIYTDEVHGTKGELNESIDKLLAETPEYYVFNGSAGALAKHPLRAKTGETVRIFFGDGGPNKASSFHMIGEIFDKVYPLGSLTSPPTNDVQTLLVPAGGGAIAEVKFDVPGKYAMVDHALSRMERGLKAMIVVDGPDRPDLFKPHQAVDPNAKTGHE